MLGDRRHQLGHRCVRGDLVRPTGVHPAEQRLDQPVADLAAEPTRDQPTDRDVLGQVEAPEGAAPDEPARRRSRPRMPLSRSDVEVGGDAHQRRWQRSDRALGPDARRRVTCGWTMWSPSPTARARSIPSGRRLSIDSAPRSTGMPATSPSRSLPPTWVDPSSTRDLEIGSQDEELPGCSQAGDTGTDDHDPLRGQAPPGRIGTTRLGWRRWHGTRVARCPGCCRDVVGRAGGRWWEPVPGGPRRSVMRIRGNASRTPTSRRRDVSCRSARSRRAARPAVVRTTPRSAQKAGVSDQAVGGAAWHRAGPRPGRPPGRTGRPGQR